LDLFLRFGFGFGLGVSLSKFEPRYRIQFRQSV
jgi:hypothetical protein